MKIQNSRRVTKSRTANSEITSADVLDSLGWETSEKRRNRNKSILMYRILNN